MDLCLTNILDLGWSAYLKNVKKQEFYPDDVANHAWQGRRLISYVDSEDTYNYSYAYNDALLRVKKVVNDVTTHFTYFNDLLMIERRGNIIIRYRYDKSGIYGFTIEEGTTLKEYFYDRDVFGNINGIYDETGNKVVTYTYTAYGLLHSMNDSSTNNIGTINKIRYKGYYYDDETSFYYCKSRYYVPRFTRWLSGDDVAYLNPATVTGLNLFVYCNNNPVMYTDESGESAALFFSIIFGAAIGGYLGYISATENNSNIGVGILTGALLGGTVGMVLGLDKAFLASGISSLASKGITNIVDIMFFGGEIDSLQSYALAFALGGLTGGLLDIINKANTMIIGMLRFGSEVLIRPALSQAIDIGLGKEIYWNNRKFLFDILSRGATYFIGGSFMKSTIFGNLQISYGKASVRGITRGVYMLLLT